MAPQVSRTFALFELTSILWGTFYKNKSSLLEMSKALTELCLYIDRVRLNHQT